MAEQKPRSLAERFAEGLTEEELSKPIRLEGVDQVFTLRTLFPSIGALRKAPPAQQSPTDQQRRQGGSL